MKLTPFSDENVLGIDIGTHSIKIVETRFSGGKQEPLRAVSGEIDLSRAGGTKDKSEACVAALKKVLATHKIRTKTAVIGIPAAAAVVDIARSPQSTAAGEMRLETTEEETYIQPLAAGGAGAASEKKTLTVTAGRGGVEARAEIVRNAGLVPVIADVNIFAALNAYLPSFTPAEKGLVLVINIGANATELAVISGGLVLAVRTVLLAGNDLSATLRRELAITPAAAEALKRTHGLLTRFNAGPASASDTLKSDEQLAIKASGLLSGRVNQLIAEIKRTIAYCAEKTPGPGMRAARLVLTGGSAELPGLDKYLAAAFGVPVEIFLPRFSVAAGLSIRRFPRERAELFTHINLLPKALLRRPNYAGRTAGYFLLLSGLAAAYYGYNLLNGRISAEMLKRRAELSVLRADLDKAREAAEEQYAEKQRTAAPAAPPKAAPAKDSFAYLKELKVSGVFADPSGSSAILVGPGESYIVKSGKMFYESGRSVKGVFTSITKQNVIVSAGGNRFELQIPK
ncbi:MAG: pilus assembly protein PilM [Elusimicrobiota bacterium]